MASQSLIPSLMLLAVTLLLVGCDGVRSSTETSKLETVVISGRSFQLELAADYVTRQRGLMHRESIPEDGGMLFVFPEASVRSFWMAYCLVDMDVIFLDTRGRITAMHKMKVQSPRQENESVAAYESRMHRTPYWSYFPAQFAIELRGGTLDQLDLHVDDKIDLDLERLKALAR